ncbi:MAG: response regulator transcription factor [Bacillota bacterium]
MTRIVIVEDDPGIRQAVKAYLSRNGCAVKEAGTGREALPLMEQADLAVLDIGLPDMDGFEVLRRVRAQHPELPVLLLTARADDMDKIVGLELGADDYLTKPFNPRELLARIRAVLRRAGRAAAGSGAERLEAGGVVVDLAAHEVNVDQRPVSLTPREFLILRHLISQPGRAVTRDQLMTALWGPDYVGDPKTVDVYVGRLREKIEADPANPVRILTVRGVGYKFAGGPHG